MKRFLIFAVLGPPLGSLVGFFILLPAISLIAGDGSGLDASRLMAFAVTLPLAYMLGVVPALLVGAIDATLEAKNFTARNRVWLCAGAGFVLGFLPLLSPLWSGYMHGPWVLLFGAVGAIPGAMCSWIAGRVKSKKA